MCIRDRCSPAAFLATHGHQRPWPQLRYSARINDAAQAIHLLPHYEDGRYVAVAPGAARAKLDTPPTLGHAGDAAAPSAPRGPVLDSLVRGVRLARFPQRKRTRAWVMWGGGGGEESTRHEPSWYA